eukprot:10802997-Ditylum_brightwellii.AAC.1
MFGQAHQKPWRTKGANSKGRICRETDDALGAGTSTDQLVSSQPGLVLQISRKLTNRRIVGATIFVDHFSDFIYVHLMTSLSREETLAAKRGYEHVANKHGVTVQELMFCGVGAHHQNGISENRIKLLTLGGHTLLLHAKCHWPEH